MPIDNFGWINPNDPKQCVWANNYLTRKGHKRNNYAPSNLDLKSDKITFSLGDYNLPQGQDRINLIQKMRSSWRAKKSRSSKNDLTFNVTIHRFAHQQLKSLAKTSDKHLSNVVEDLIVHAYSLDSLYSEKYNNAFKRKKIDHDLDFTAAEKHKSSGDYDKQLKSRIAHLENHYTSLLNFSSSTLKKYCQAMELIATSQLDISDLDDLGKKKADNQYKRLEKRYLKPLKPVKNNVACSEKNDNPEGESH